MVLLVNYLMVSHCKVLYEDAPSISSLDGMLNILTPTPISYIVASIIFDLIHLLYFNMYYSIDNMSDDI